MTSRFDARRSRAQTDLIARESELSQIMSCWSAARAGQSQTVVLTGEAGIGKSRLVRAVQESPALKPCIVVQWQCVRHRSGSALHPVTRWVEQAAGMRVTDSLAQRGERLLCALERLGLTPQDIGCLLALIGLSHERYPLIEAAAEHLKRVTHEAVVHWLVQLARRAPLLLVLEDAHWIDPSSRGLVGLILSELRGDRLMLLVTARTDSGTSVPAWSGAHEVTLERLDPASRAALVSAQFGGRPVSQEVLAQIVSRTDGIPLFVEELCQSLLEDGTVCETARGYEFARPLSGISIPATLEASLAARLDRLGSSRRVVQVAAVIGREFSLPVLARCLNLPQPLVASSLAYPVAAGLIETQADAVSTEWRFRHALIREAAYASLSRRERVRLHGQVASALSGPGVAGAPAELLAHHLQEAGDAPGALACWRQAGDLAMRRYAPIEAELHYRAALRLVAGALTGVNAAQCELDLQMRLGATLMQTGGAGTFTPVVERARDLAQSLGRPDEYLGALAGVATALSIAGRFREAIAVCAEGPTDWLAGAAPMAKIARQMRIGIARLGLGELCDATREFERALVALGHVPEENRPLLAGADPVVVLQVYSARTLALRGSLSKAVALAAAALTRADALEHPSTQSWALGIAASLALTAGDVGTGTMHAQRALEIAQRFRLQMRIAQASLHLGRARVGTGEVDEGVALMRHGCELWEQTVGIYCGAEYAALAAHSLMVAGHPNAAAEFVAAGERFQRACEERTQAADLMRMRALLSIDSLGPSQVEGLLRSAMSLADAQGAALLQLRAATDLADLLYTQGRAQEARLCLMPAMERLAEPETFQDVRRARDLLTMLGA